MSEEMIMQNEVQLPEENSQETAAPVEEKLYQTRHVITKTGTDVLTPMALIMGLYVIMHGNISPGGGFQGGVLVASSAVLIYLGYGFKAAFRKFDMELLHVLESVAAILYIAVAALGIIYGGNFAWNVCPYITARGELFSGGTISLMNCAVGFKVFTGITFLVLLMLSQLAASAEEEEMISEVLDK